MKWRKCMNSAGGLGGRMQRKVWYIEVHGTICVGYWPGRGTFLLYLPGYPRASFSWPELVPGKYYSKNVASLGQYPAYTPTPGHPGFAKNKNVYQCMPCSSGLVNIFDLLKYYSLIFGALIIQKYILSLSIYLWTSFRRVFARQHVIYLPS